MQDGKVLCLKAPGMEPLTVKWDLPDTEDFAEFRYAEPSPKKICKFFRKDWVGGGRALTLSLLRVINAKIPLQPHKKYDITQYGELDFS